MKEVSKIVFEPFVLASLRRKTLARLWRLLSRKKAFIILFTRLGIDKNLIAGVLGLCERTIRYARNIYKRYGFERVLHKARKEQKKYDNDVFKELVFKILHTPPSEYGINRTTWTRKLIRDVAIYKEGHVIGLKTIDNIIKNAGYRFCKAREVLTSNDPFH